MILSGKQIIEEVREGNIFITDFDETHINPNSYNLKLHNKLLIYTEPVLDMKKNNPTRELIIPPEGLVLKPGELYLGRTVEYTETIGFVPKLDGRSSIGRLGVFTHVTAGFGDNGFKGYWTLEIKAVKPIRVYADVEFVQIYYNTLKGELTEYKNGKYQSNDGVQSSMLYKDFHEDIHEEATENTIFVTELKVGDMLIESSITPTPQVVTRIDIDPSIGMYYVFIGNLRIPIGRHQTVTIREYYMRG